MGLRDRLKKANAAARAQREAGQEARDRAAGDLAAAREELTAARAHRAEVREEHATARQQHREARAAEREALRAEMPRRQHRVKFAGVRVADGEISRGGESYPVAGVEVSVETAGQIDRRLSLTRTAGGAVALGPLGAVLGAVARKKTDDRQVFLLVSGPDFAWSVEVPHKKLAAAHDFAAKVTALGRSTPSDSGG